jgi:hypothetical protein
MEGLNFPIVLFTVAPFCNLSPLRDTSTNQRRNEAQKASLRKGHKQAQRSLALAQAGLLR